MGIELLTAAKVRNAKPKRGKRVKRLADGGNLFLQAMKSRGGEHINRSWLFKYELDGKRHEIGLGSLNTIGLAEARDRAREMRQQLLDGIDPLAARDDARAQAERERLARLAEAAKAITFRQCADEYMAIHSKDWKNAKHAAQWPATLKTYAYPLIGDLAVADVDTPHLVKLLQPVFGRIPDTAMRLRGRIEMVLNYATAAKYRKGDNPARWEGNLKILLGGTKGDSKHQPALQFADAPAFMTELRSRDSTSARALEFLILCAARTTETIEAEWGEVDLESRVWTVPGSRMKAGKEHRVPLSGPAVAILESLPRRGKFVFARPTHKPLSNMALLELLRGMRPGVTVHGFRATFKTWANERTSYPKHIAEAALAHINGDKVEKSYERGDLLDKRSRLMAEWARFLGKPLPAEAGATARKNVIAIR